MSLIKIYLKHKGPHTPYYDVAMPLGAATIIRENVEHHTPSELVLQVQSQFPLLQGHKSTLRGRI